MNDSELSIDLAQRYLLTTARILIVDDSKAMREVIQAMLRAHGVADIALAEDGVDAFKKLENFSPDLILLDVFMPQMDGFEFCSQLRTSNHRMRDVQIVVLTGLDSVDARVYALNAGVSGIIHKKTIQTLLIQDVCRYLQQAHMLKVLATNENITAADMQQARDILLDLLPEEKTLEKIKQDYHIEIKSLYRPSQALGGDYWFASPVDPHNVIIFIADFSGHGVMAGIYTFRIHTFMREYAGYNLPPAEILKTLNDYFQPMLPAGQYITCFLGIIDTQRHTLRYAAAAMPPAILAENGKVRFLDCSGDVVGAYNDAIYSNHEISFNKGSALIIYSDALVEMNMQNSTLFTPDTLLQHVQDTLVDDIYTTHARVAKKIKESEHNFDDDLTMLTISRK